MTPRSHLDRARGRRAAAAVAVIVAALAGLGCTFELDAEPVDTESRNLERTFPLAAGERLRLANLAGSATIEPGPAGEVRVEATLHAAGRDAAHTQQLLDGMEWVRDEDGWALSYPVREHSTFHYAREGTFGWASQTSTRYLGRKVVVTGRKRGSTPTLFADLKIFLPAQGAVKLRNAVGVVDGGELAGELEIDTGSGDVKVSSFDGVLVVDTGSGDVWVGAVVGSIDVDTGSGDVDLGRVDGERVSADTGSGDIHVGPGRLRELVADTGSGDIEVRDVDAERMEFDTGSGDVTVDSPLNWARSITADTGSGDVEIYGDPDATFKISADQGSGDLEVRYDDVRWVRRGRKLVGAERGDMHTAIDCDTGSGDCVLAPR